MAVVKVTSKGQITLPVGMRQRLGISDKSHLEVTIEGEELRLRRQRRIRPLSSKDPIWEQIGAGASGLKDASSEHDRYLAEGEVRSWGSSS